MAPVNLELARWLTRPGVTVSNLQHAIVKRALLDIGILEEPPGSNRGPEIDGYVKRAGSPLGSFWCACAVREWFVTSGSLVPVSAAGNCDVWVSWAKRLKLWSLQPVPGAAVVYKSATNATDAVHIGVVVRVAPILLSVEGNTTIDGKFDRNGIAVDLKRIDPSRVMGYTYPSLKA